MDKNQDLGSGINIQDLQHCKFLQNSHPFKYSSQTFSYTNLSLICEELLFLTSFGLPSLAFLFLPPLVLLKLLSYASFSVKNYPFD
jgi:hypothetical protein